MSEPRHNLAAFLRVIRQGETTQRDDAYCWLFGSTEDKPILFLSFADHPRVRAYEKYDGQFIKNGKIDYTTAAGAYQITATTWRGLVRQNAFPDFSPRSQDLAAIALIRGRKALDDIQEGRFEAAVMKCSPEWASLPGDVYGQGGIPIDRARAVYESYGGLYEGSDRPPLTDAERAAVERDLDAQLHWWRDLTPERQEVMAEMWFDLGAGLRRFVRTIAHIQSGHFADAAAEMLDSKWARQRPERAKRLSKQMESSRKSKEI